MASKRPQGETRLQQEAIADFTELIRLEPGCAEAYDGRGWAYDQKGERTKAREDFAKAKELGLKEGALPAKVQERMAKDAAKSKSRDVEQTEVAGDSLLRTESPFPKEFRSSSAPH